MSVVGTDEAIARRGTPWGPVWQVRAYDDVKQILTDQRFQPIRPNSAINVLLAEGRFDEAIELLDRNPEAAATGGNTTELDPDVRALRLRAINAVSEPHNVRRRASEIQKLANELAGDLVDAPHPVTASQRFSAPLCARGMCVLLGVSAAESAEFVTYVGCSTSVSGISLISVKMRELIAARLRDPQPDVVSELVTAADNRQHLAQLTNVLAWLLMGSNWENPSAVIDFALAKLFAHPDQRQRLVADPGLIGSAVDETFRLFVSFEAERGGLVRRAVTEAEVAGAHLAVGDFVLADVAAANRDPRVFADPLAFDVGRRPNPHLTFGNGPFMCKFIPMTRTLVGTGLQTLLTTLPDLRPAPAPADPDPAERVRSGDFEDLWVAW
jgi:cytochrome P450